MYAIGQSPHHLNMTVNRVICSFLIFGKMESALFLSVSNHFSYIFAKETMLLFCAGAL
jgi:hypothetical protein